MEVSSKLADMVARHEAGVIAPSPKNGVTVQVTVQIPSAVFFFGLSVDEVRGLTAEEFDTLCRLTGQSPDKLEETGNLDVKHDATIICEDPSNVVEDEY